MNASNLTKGTIVTFTLPKIGTAVSGVISKSTKKDLCVTYEVGEGNLANYSAASNKMEPSALATGLKVVAHTGTPISALLQSRIDELNGKGPKFKKGDIVTFEHKGQPHTGRVTKGGARPTVQYTLNSALEIPSRELTPAKPPVTDPELAEWDVSSMTDDGMGRDFPMFTATITRNGVPVFQARCLGDGGPLHYDPIKKGTSADIQAWDDALKAYTKNHARKERVVDELYPEYAWSMKPTGMTFAAYLTELSAGF